MLKSRATAAFTKKAKYPTSPAGKAPLFGIIISLILDIPVFVAALLMCPCAHKRFFNAFFMYTYIADSAGFIFTIGISLSLFIDESV